jgi:predicted RNase H-like HicB family nuclease
MATTRNIVISPESFREAERYSAVIEWSDEDAVYIARVPELPGCMADGETREEALCEIRISTALDLEVRKLHGDPIPEPKLFATA